MEPGSGSCTAPYQSVYLSKICCQVELMSVERYSPSSDTWEMVKEMRRKRWGGGGAVLHRRLIVVGGKGKRVGHTGEVFTEAGGVIESLSISRSSLLWPSYNDHNAPCHPRRTTHGPPYQATPQSAREPTMLVWSIRPGTGLSRNKSVFYFYNLLVFSLLYIYYRV